MNILKNNLNAAKITPLIFGPSALIMTKVRTDPLFHTKPIAKQGTIEVANNPLAVNGLGDILCAYYLIRLVVNDRQNIQDFAPGFVISYVTQAAATNYLMLQGFSPTNALLIATFFVSATAYILEKLV